MLNILQNLDTHCTIAKVLVAAAIADRLADYYIVTNQGELAQQAIYEMESAYDHAYDLHCEIMMAEEQEWAASNLANEQAAVEYGSAEYFNDIAREDALPFEPCYNSPMEQDMAAYNAELRSQVEDDDDLPF